MYVEPVNAYKIYSDVKNCIDAKNIAESGSGKIPGAGTGSQNTDNSLFLSVYKDVASQETHLITAKFGYVNAGGLVNHLNSAEDVANVLNNNQYTLVVQNEDLPAHLKEGIKAVTGGSISSIA